MRKIRFSDTNVTVTMILLAFAAFASQAMVRVLDTLLPQIAADFMVSVGAASIVVTLYAVAHGAFVFVAGPVGDRFGKTRVVAVACAVSGVAVLLCATAQSLSDLAIARFASGMTVAWIVPLGLAFVGDVVPEERRQAVLARFMSGQILGQMFGQAAGGVLGDQIGWRGVFVLLATAFALVAAALACQSAIRQQQPAAPAREIRRSVVADYATVFENRWARVVLAAVFFEGLFSFGVFAFVGADLKSRFGLSLTSVGAVVALFAVGGLWYGAVAGALVRRLGPVNLAACGGGLIGCGFLVLAVQTHWWSAPAAVAAIGLGFYMLHSTLLTNATQLCPHMRGTAVAAFGAALYFGQTAGVALAGAAIDGLGAPLIFLVAAIFMPTIAIWFALQLRRRSALVKRPAETVGPRPEPDRASPPTQSLRERPPLDVGRRY